MTRRSPSRIAALVFAISALLLAGTGMLRAQTEKAVPPENLEGTMTLERMGGIISRLDSEAQSAREGVWQFKIEETPVVIITDAAHNRMRIMVPIRSAAELSPQDLKRIMQANFDTALDSRYAIARDILWSTFIHPLRTLHDKQFIAAIGQTVNLALTYGTTYTSGLLTFGGGDSNAIIQRQLIDRLLKKGEEI